MKKAYFFTLDMLIAVIIIISALSVVHMYSISKEHIIQETYYSSDLVDILSTVQLFELTDPNLQMIINQTSIGNTNLTVLEYVGRLYILDEKIIAEQLIGNLTDTLLPQKLGYGVWIEGINESKDIYDSGGAQGSRLISSKQMISGIEETKPIEGFNTRIFITDINKQSASSYAYFGGYVGDGNLSKRVELPDNIISVNRIYLELDVADDFMLYINNNLAGAFYPVEGNMSSDKWDLGDGNLSFIQPGVNYFNFSFFGPKSDYIAGGYILVSYDTNEIDTSLIDYGNGSATKTIYFPSIYGVINYYSSFYIPGDLQDIEIYLHYFNDYSIYMNIGNITVYLNSNSSGEEIVYLDNSNLTELDYNFLSRNNIPLRLGSEEGNITIIFGENIPSDSVLVTDVSGSMLWRMSGGTSNGVQRNCDDPDITNTNTAKISVAKCLGKIFVDVILLDPDNRVGLVSYESAVESDKIQALTNSQSALYNTIESYNANGATCICCGINEGIDMIDTESTPDKFRSIVVMSDGQANRRCTDNYCQLVWWWGWWWWSCDSDAPQKDAIDAACNASQNYNITVHAIGFGGDADVGTLQAIAACGNGSYYGSDNYEDLKEIYENLAYEASNSPVTYAAQTINISNASSNLYPGSYMRFTYIPDIPPTEYGKIPVTIESPAFGNNISQGIFNIPNIVDIYGARATSYSGPMWTDKGKIKNLTTGAWIPFYQLADYASNYQILGDPYIIEIPANLIQHGENVVEIGTGLSPDNATGGSPDNKIIYTLAIPLYVNYTDIFAEAHGCIWSVDFEDNSSSILKIPTSYNATDTCVFNASTNCDQEFSVDAVKNAVCHLFKQLDFDNNGKLFVNIDENDLAMEGVSIQGIPYMWGPTIAEVRVWQ